ncbi:MAG: inositol monophosphatase [Deltaproteobacteria bacterium]|nr:inositol monophosphatase [Deltaproteobacteria bacterium]
MEIKNLAISAAQKAGRLLKERLGDSGRIEFKGAVDIVTEMDRASEDQILTEIKKFFPEHGILSEESAEIKTMSPYRWLIDPLDGTTNYSHGFPVFCVSIAVENAGEVVLGVVYNPMLDELFTAEKGGGAYLNGKKIFVSQIKTLDKSLLATGFPYDIRKTGETNLDHFSNFAVAAQAIRRAGSAALDMSYVACGRFDGFWEMKLKPWDVSAAGLIVKEAGGVLSDFKGRAFSIHGKETLATNGLIHAEMLSVLAKK